MDAKCAGKPCYRRAPSLGTVRFDRKSVAISTLDKDRRELPLVDGMRKDWLNRYPTKRGRSLSDVATMLRFT